MTDGAHRENKQGVLATIAYLVTVALCLYLPMWFPPWVEGPDVRIAFPLAVASAVHAALRPTAGIHPRWERLLALAWMIGCTACTPHLFPPPSDLQMTVTLLVAGLAGCGLAGGAIMGVLRNSVLGTLRRASYGLALLLAGLAFVRFAALAIVPPSDHSLRLFVAGVLGSSVLVGVGALVESRSRRTTA